jgi:hypothetical protein
MTDRSAHKDDPYNQIGMIQVFGEVVGQLSLIKGLYREAGRGALRP